MAMGEVSSCDILYLEDLDEFNRQYLKNTTQVAETCQDFDLSDNCMVAHAAKFLQRLQDEIWHPFSRNGIMEYLNNLLPFFLSQSM